jgi:prepilin-type N-terminal cleavage/methylation domain-containing protein
MLRGGRVRRGFTLIELMIVVAIIAILASIAIPAYQRYSLKAKQGERDMLLENIATATLTYLAEHDGFPHVAGAGSTINTPQNPAGAPRSVKRNFIDNAGDWRFLLTQPMGQVYFSYRVFGQTANGGSFFWIEALGDLDGNGIQSQNIHWWLNVPGLTQGWERYSLLDTDTPTDVF